MSQSVHNGPGKTRSLSWSRTVERELVHRASVAEVLLTDVRPAPGEHEFDAAAVWSRSHVTFPRDGSGVHSPLILVETLRQLGIYIPLAFYSVSPTAPAVITDLAFDIDPSAEPRALSGPTKVSCRAAVSGVRRDGQGKVSGLRLEVLFLAGGTAFARARGGARFLAPERYAALAAAPAGVASAEAAAPHPTRTDEARTGLTSPSQGGERAGEARVRRRPYAAEVAVCDERDVMLARAEEPAGGGGGRGHGMGAGDAGALLIEPADMAHPFFFDHPADHVPGMVLLEAARQAATLESGGFLTRPCFGRLVPVRFTEITPAPRVSCVPHHNMCVFRFLQEGSQTAYGMLRYK
jgi:hypothetical protein